MLHATQIRLYPTLKQQEYLAVQFGCSRWVWNEALSVSEESYRKTGKSLGYHSLSVRLPKLKKEHEWLADAHAQVLQQSLQNLAAAYERYFRKQNQPPRFKTKNGRQSIQYPQNVRIEGNKIRLPKVGWVRCIVHREIDGKVKTVTISKLTSGRYYASILTDDEQVQAETVMPEGASFTGIDVGLIDFAVTGKGQHFRNPQYMKRAENNLKRKQRKLARKQPHSRGRKRAALKVARAHERVANSRKDYLHKLSRKLVDENQAIAVEDLSVKTMVRNPNLAKAISEAGWSTFTRFVEYKAGWAGKPFMRTDRFYPSSKTCSFCGSVCDCLTLRTRRWTCAGCGAVHDRDENAARNIGFEADRIWIVRRKPTASGIGAAAGRGSVSLRKRLSAAKTARSREARSLASAGQSTCGRPGN